VSVLVDTPIWSMAVRRQAPRREHIDTLGELISAGEVNLIGPIRQEVLSGIRDPRQYERLRDYLRAFPDLPIESRDYEDAARWFNVCRAHGVQGSHTDFLLCAIAIRRKLEIYTNDSDFQRYAQHLPVRLYTP